MQLEKENDWSESGRVKKQIIETDVKTIDDTIHTLSVVENNRWGSSLENLSLEALYDFLDDIKMRIADGILSDNPVYTLNQSSKAEVVRKEIERRLDK